MLKIFVVDDEYYACLAIEKVIKEWDNGCTIYRFENGKAAFEVIQNIKPDVVLTDIKMPILGGLDLSKKIYDSGLSIDIIIISGYSEFEYARSAMKFGVKDYILKPIDKKELIGILNNIKEKRKLTDQNCNDDKIKPQNSLTNTNSELINEINEYINSNYDKDINLEQLAKDKYFINYSYLSRIYKEKTGLSFTKYILKIRMEKAKEFIHKGGISVSDVALIVGYNDVSNFIQAFKKYYGYTPGTLNKRK